MKRGLPSPLPLWQMAEQQQRMALDLEQNRLQAEALLLDARQRHHEARNMVRNAQRLLNQGRTAGSHQSMEAVLTWLEPNNRVSLLHNLQRLVPAWRAASRVPVVCKLSPLLPEYDPRYECLLRCVDNLVQNAIKATGHGQIRIQIWGREHYNVVVNDTGGGLGQGAYEKGLGVGLALIRQSLDPWGGELWMSSRPGVGVRTQLWLPLHPDTPAPFL